MGRLTPKDLGLFTEACATLAVASLSIRFLPFPLLARLMAREGAPVRKGAPLPGPVSLAVTRASHRLPWKTVCFQEGLAAHWMLRRRGLPSMLHYGIRHQSDRLTAHVWVKVDGKIVIGEEQPGQGHSVVAVYPAS